MRLDTMSVGNLSHNVHLLNEQVSAFDQSLTEFQTSGEVLRMLERFSERMRKKAFALEE